MLADQMPPVSIGVATPLTVTTEVAAGALTTCPVTRIVEAWLKLPCAGPSITMAGGGLQLAPRPATPVEA